MEDLLIETMTMKIMIYSLYESLKETIKAINSKCEVVELEVWEEECRQVARKMLEEKESESEK